MNSIAQYIYSYQNTEERMSKEGGRISSILKDKHLECVSRYVYSIAEGQHPSEDSLQVSADGTEYWGPHIRHDILWPGALHKSDQGNEEKHHYSQFLLLCSHHR